MKWTELQCEGANGWSTLDDGWSVFGIRLKPWDGCMIFPCTFTDPSMVDFLWCITVVGKYILRPMDPSWV